MSQYRHLIIGSNLFRHRQLNHGALTLNIRHLLRVNRDLMSATNTDLKQIHHDLRGNWRRALLGDRAHSNHLQ
jgi:hypothetical protein